MTSATVSFGGQNALTGFARDMSDLLWWNEVDRRNPYALSRPSTPYSGYSFGAVQWDIPNFAPFDPSLSTADEILKDILTNAKDANGQLIFDKATVDALFKIDPVTNDEVGPAYSIGDKHALDGSVI